MQNSTSLGFRSLGVTEYALEKQECVVLGYPESIFIFKDWKEDLCHVVDREVACSMQQKGEKFAREKAHRCHQTTVLIVAEMVD